MSRIGQVILCAGEDDNPGNEGESEGEEEEEEEGPGDDMQLAWENLEVAREIFTTHQSSHTRELAGGSLYDTLQSYPVSGLPGLCRIAWRGSLVRWSFLICHAPACPCIMPVMSDNSPPMPVVNFGLGTGIRHGEF